MASMQGAGAGDGKGKDNDKDKEGSSNKSSSSSNDRPRIQREGGVRSREDVMNDRREKVYGERSVDKVAGSARGQADRAWRKAVERKMQQGTLSDFDRDRWVRDDGLLKTRTQIRADYEERHFQSRADSAWNRGDWMDYAKFKTKTWAAAGTNVVEDFKAAPIDTLADLTRNPLVAGALSMTGIGAGALAGLQLGDTVLDVAQEEVTAGAALRTALADALDTTGVGEGLGMAKSLVSAGLRNPDALPELVAGRVGGMLGGKVATDLASNIAKSNPMMAATMAAVGPTIGKIGATQLLKQSTPAEEAVARTAPTKSPLVTADAPSTPSDTQGPNGAPRRTQSDAPEADALALVRQFQTERLGGAPSNFGVQGEDSLPYYNTYQPYRTT